VKFQERNYGFISSLFPTTYYWMNSSAREEQSTYSGGCHQFPCR